MDNTSVAVKQILHDFREWLASEKGQKYVHSIEIEKTEVKELAIDVIQVRGVEAPFTTWYTFNTSTNTTITSQTVLSYQGGNNPDLTTITMAGDTHKFIASTGPLGIKPGETFVVYVKAPGNVDRTDTGSSATVLISSLQATQVLRLTVSSPRT